MIPRVLIYIPVPLLTKPEDMNNLAKLYVMYRPIGFWKPVKKETKSLYSRIGEKIRWEEYNE